MVALQVVPQVAARIRTPRDGLSAAMSSAATMLGRPLSYEQAYAVSGHAFVPCVDPTHPCKSLWRVDDRTDGMLHVCARVGIVAHGFHRPGESSHAIASLRLDPEKAASHRAALAKPFRLALETGGVVIRTQLLGVHRRRGGRAGGVRSRVRCYGRGGCPRGRSR